ncbi:MAG: transglycosylase family protein [Solirubrobacterales bacterium]
MNRKIKTATQSTVAAAAATGMIVIGGVAAAPAAELADINLGERDTRLERVLDRAELDLRYETLYERAKKLGVEPKRSAVERELMASELRPKLKRLQTNVADAREAKIEARKERRKAREQARKAAREAEAAGLPAPTTEASGGESGDVADPSSVGVSQGTLESIAACESGGDPGAVSSDGSYRGKYQFDTGTWASVGGSGDPAAASESEQDYRAALLYQQAGSSPWPVCGG